MSKDPIEKAEETVLSEAFPLTLFWLTHNKNKTEVKCTKVSWPWYAEWVVEPLDGEGVAKLRQSPGSSHDAEDS